MKELACQYADSTLMFSMDDKCKVPLGKPGHPVAAVARGKQVSEFFIFWYDFVTASNVTFLPIN